VKKNKKKRTPPPNGTGGAKRGGVGRNGGLSGANTARGGAVSHVAAPAGRGEGTGFFFFFGQKKNFCFVFFFEIGGFGGRDFNSPPGGAEDFRFADSLAGGRHLGGIFFFFFFLFFFCEKGGTDKKKTKEGIKGGEGEKIRCRG